MSHIAIYCGWYDGNVSGPFAVAQGRVHARRVCLSFAFVQRGHHSAAKTENWCGPLLAKGATCTMGCVYEPYLSGTPNVAAFLARWMATGFTFGEAAWAAQPVPFLADHGHRRPALPAVRQTAATLHAELARATARSSNGPFCGSRTWRSPTARPSSRWPIIWKTSTPPPTAPC